MQVSLEFRDLIVNWKNSKQGISSDNLNMYTLLDLSNNQLSGQIPASLGTLRALKLLNISHNKLSGKIPTSFGDLENIETLDLSHNKLSGSIPPTLTKLQQLTILDVSNNQLTGRIPDGGQMGTMVLDPNYYANNSGLCGMQIHVSCPENEPHHRRSHRSMIIRSHGFYGKVCVLGTQLDCCWQLESYFLPGILPHHHLQTPAGIAHIVQIVQSGDGIKPEYWIEGGLHKQ